MKVQPHERITFIATISLPNFCCDLTYHLQPRSAPFFYVLPAHKQKYIPCPKSFLCAQNKTTEDVCQQGGDWVLLHR